MKRISQLPAMVFGYIASALYLTALGYFYNAQGRPVSALFVGAVALAVMTPVFRQAWRS